MVKFLTSNGQIIKNVYQGEELKFINSPTEGENIMFSVGEIYLNNPGTSTLNDGYFSTGIGGTRIDSLTKAGGEYILYLYSDDSEWENMSILQLPGSIRSPLYKVGNNIYIGKFTAVGNETGIGVSNNIGTGKTLTFSNYTFAEYAPSFATSDNLQKVYQGSELIWEIPIETVRETTTESIPFTTTYYEDPSKDLGTLAITTQGVNGVRTVVWDITYRNGSEIGRVRVSDSVTTQPITRRIARGTRPMLVSNPTLHGPFTRTVGTTTISNLYYVLINRKTKIGEEYRIDMVTTGRATSIGYYRIVAGKGPTEVHGQYNTDRNPYTFVAEYSFHENVDRFYVVNATDIKVYRIK